MKKKKMADKAPTKRKHKETHYTYLVLHEGALLSLRAYCKLTSSPYKNILMRICRWHKELPNEYLLFDTSIAEDAEFLSKENHPIGTPCFAEKCRRKYAAESRVKRASERRALQLLRDYGNPKDSSEFADRQKSAGEHAARTGRVGDNVP
jgi:hypothetical protein